MVYEVDITTISGTDIIGLAAAGVTDTQVTMGDKVTSEERCLQASAPQMLGRTPCRPCGCPSHPVNVVADIAVQAPLETFDHSQREVDHCGLYRIFVSRIPSPARRSRRSLQRPQKTISLPHGVPPYTHRASSTFPYQDRFLNQPTPLSRMIPTLCGHPQVCFQLP